MTNEINKTEKILNYVFFLIARYLSWRHYTLSTYNRYIFLTLFLKFNIINKLSLSPTALPNIERIP